MKRIEAIATVCGQELLLYEYHSTGREPGHSQDRLTLHFVLLPSHQKVVMHFNVSTKKARKSKRGNAGSQMPKGQFRPPKSGSFLNFWYRLGLEMPRRPSEFHKKLRQLSNLALKADLKDCGTCYRAENKTATLANIAPEHIQQRVYALYAPKNIADQSRSSPKKIAISLESPCSQLAISESTEPPTSLTTYQTASAFSGKQEYRRTKTPEEQSTDEWLHHYEQALPKQHSH